MGGAIYLLLTHFHSLGCSFVSNTASTTSGCPTNTVHAVTLSPLPGSIQLLQQGAPARDGLMLPASTPGCDGMETLVFVNTDITDLTACGTNPPYEQQFPNLPAALYTCSLLGSQW